MQVCIYECMFAHMNMCMYERMFGKQARKWAYNIYIFIYFKFKCYG